MRGRRESFQVFDQDVVASDSHQKVTFHHLTEVVLLVLLDPSVLSLRVSFLLLQEHKRTSSSSVCVNQISEDSSSWDKLIVLLRNTADSEYMCF